MNVSSKTLIITLNYFGDVLMTAPLIWFLKKKGCEIAVCAGGRGKGAAALIQGADRWIFREKRDTLLSRRRLAAHIRDFAPETVILLRNSHFTHGLAKRSNAGRILSSSAPLVRGLKLEHVDLKSAHVTHKALDYARHIFGEEPVYEASLRITESPRVPGRDYVLLFPGTTRPSKMWPVEKWISLGEMIIEKTGFLPVFMGAAEDKGLIRAINGAEYEKLNLIGMTSVTEMPHLIRDSRCVVTVDNGAMHLADLMEKKTVALFGSTDPEIVGPVSPDSSVAGLKGDCLMCGKNRCRLGYNRCIGDLEVEEVFNLVV